MLDTLSSKQLQKVVIQSPCKVKFPDGALKSVEVDQQVELSEYEAGQLISSGKALTLEGKKTKDEKEKAKTEAQGKKEIDEKKKSKEK